MLHYHNKGFKPLVALFYHMFRLSLTCNYCSYIYNSPKSSTIFKMGYRRISLILHDEL